MIVFQRCGVEVEEGESQTCASDSEIDQTLEGSYILLIENYETYDHSVNPSYGEIILKKTHIYWYTLSSVMAQDYQKTISFTDVEYSKQNVGLSLYPRTDKMYQTKDMLTRPLSYKHKKGENYVRKFAIAITFEIDVTGYTIVR